MPSSTFPRPSAVSVVDVTGFGEEGPLLQKAQSGHIKRRSITQRGRTWKETYSFLRAGNADVEAFISYLNWAWNTGAQFNIKHLTIPGSGIAPNGTGTGGITVSGASQTGDTLTTTGWPTSTNNVVRAGDLLAVAGLDYRIRAVEDCNSDGSGNADIVFNPPILTGGSPANGAAVTTTDVSLLAAIIEPPSMPSISNAFWWTDLSVTFRETL